jgi:hypothetical protein
MNGVTDRSKNYYNVLRKNYAIPVIFRRSSRKAFNLRFANCRVYI